MQSTKILSGPNEFASEFERCCRKYSTLRIAVAWCGDPKRTLPYQHIEKFRGALSAVVGIGFEHTHPDSIAWLQRIGANVRIFRRQADLFHPKVYLFEDGDDYALFLGSSNLTFSGFYDNVEVNVLVAGKRAGDGHADLGTLEDQIKAWCSSEQSFRPTARWLEQYRKEYEKNAKRERESHVRTGRRAEEEAPTSSWLQRASWDAYLKEVRDRLLRYERTSEGYLKVLRAAEEQLGLLWRVEYFDEIERRRIIGGIGEYGWLGHVSASGRFRHLLVKGTVRDRAAIVTAVNEIAALNTPIPWKKLEANLRKLVQLGFTMKVWGRLLTLVRPEIYCTVASPGVRANLAKALDTTIGSFEQPKGYVALIRRIHSWPWFNSDRPRDPSDAAIWAARTAFLDAIFYEGEGPQ